MITLNINGQSVSLEEQDIVKLLLQLTPQEMGLNVRAGRVGGWGVLVYDESQPLQLSNTSGKRNKLASSGSFAANGPFRVQLNVIK